LLDIEALTSRPMPGLQLLGERASIAGLERQGPKSVGGSYRPVRVRDGWAGLSLTRPDDFAVVPALIEGHVDGDEWSAIEQWARSRSAVDVASRAQLLGLAGVRIPTEREPPIRGPVLRSGTGKRQRRQSPVVVDLTSLWAGPLCAHLLGLAGARVIKVESVRRPDGARSGPTAFFDLLHAGHESVALDFSAAGDRSALAALIAKADVVLESSRPRAMRQLGIGAEDVVATGTIWTSITAYGGCGPLANNVGYGDDVAAAAGLVAWDDGVPMPCGDAIADPLSGVQAALATLQALAADQTCLIDVSMRDVAAATLELDSGQPAATVTPLPPVARAAAAVAAKLGEHTDSVLGEFGIAR
jgi:hypothetical protein